MVSAKEITQTLASTEKDVIAYAVENGFTSGSIGNVEWELENDHQESLTLIAAKIRFNVEYYGNTSWKLTFKRYKTLEL